MKTYLLIALISLTFLGCSKKEDSTPSPTTDLVGNWKMVAFVVNPPLSDGTTDYLAYERQIFGYNCSQIDFFYNFKSDKTFTESMQSVCQSSGTTTDTLFDGTWAISGNNLSLTFDDGTGSQQSHSYQVDLHSPTMKLTFTNGGTTYNITLNKQ